MNAPQRTVESVIFDLDGVLTDTSEFHFQAWSRIAGELGVITSATLKDEVRGLSREASLRKALNGRDTTPEEGERLMARKNAYYSELIATLTPTDVLPGTQELIAELRLMGIKIAVASASRNAVPVLERLGLLSEFDAICDGSDVKASKPAPDLFLLAAERLGTDPANCIVIEDAQAGVRAGHAAGMRVVGIGDRSIVGEAEVVLPSLEGARPADILIGT